MKSLILAVTSPQARRVFEIALRVLQVTMQVSCTVMLRILVLVCGASTRLPRVGPHANSAWYPQGTFYHATGIAHRIAPRRNHR